MKDQFSAAQFKSLLGQLGCSENRFKPAARQAKVFLPGVQTLLECGITDSQKLETRVMAVKTALSLARANYLTATEALTDYLTQHPPSFTVEALRHDLRPTYELGILSPGFDQSEDSESLLQLLATLCLMANNSMGSLRASASLHSEIANKTEYPIRIGGFNPMTIQTQRSVAGVRVIDGLEQMASLQTSLPQPVYDNALRILHNLKNATGVQMTFTYQEGKGKPPVLSLEL